MFKKLGKGIVEDVRGRLPWYHDDWREGINSGLRIFAPATYIFFASAIPALAFGEQIEHATDGALNGVNILAATAICGLIQAFLGGQPLLILGVAQPVVLVYIYMYDFLDDQDKVDLFLPWAAWSCIWSGLFQLFLAVTNVCGLIDKFTRFSGELFEMLIAVLFMQEAIVGLISEFEEDEHADDHEPADPSEDFVASRYHWRLVNGLWSLLLAFGLLFTSVLFHGARSWRFGKGWVRSMLADYGVPLMIALWTGVSYAVSDAPNDVPRRLSIPNTWDETRSWRTATDLGSVDTWLIFAGIVPGIIIGVLYYYDHNVSAKLAQQKEFNLKKPPSYHYDFFLLSLMTILCGLLGLPPANGAIPQSPMHSKSLASLKKQLRKRDSRRVDKKLKASNSTPDFAQLQNGAADSPNATPEKTGMQKVHSMQEFNILDTNASMDNKNAALATTSSIYNTQTNLLNSQANILDTNASLYTTMEAATIIEVKEQRLSNLIQSVLVALCLGVTPVLQWIPKSVLWGYFAYMSVINLPGTEFWDRVLLLFTDAKRRVKLLEAPHPAFLETVPTSIINKFTILQIVLLLVVWGITFAGFYGIVFPIVIMMFVPARQYLMPKFFSPEHLRELDMAEYEEVPAIEPDEAYKTAKASGVKEAEMMRDKLDERMVGLTVKQSVTREEIRKRRQSVEEATELRAIKSAHQLGKGLPRRNNP